MINKGDIIILFLEEDFFSPIVVVIIGLVGDELGGGAGEGGTGDVGEGNGRFAGVRGREGEVLGSPGAAEGEGRGEDDGRFREHEARGGIDCGSRERPEVLEECQGLIWTSERRQKNTHRYCPEGDEHGRQQDEVPIFRL